MDTASEQAYAGMGSKNGAMAGDLKSKEGTNREGTRGASEEVIDQGQKVEQQAGFSFFGNSDGANPVGNSPMDNGHTESTLNAPRMPNGKNPLSGAY